MDQNELSRIINQYAIYLQVEKGLQSGTHTVYLSGVRYFFSFCTKNYQKLFLSENWGIEEIGVRELEFFFREHLEVRQWKINTVISYLTGIRSFFRFLHEKGILKKNPILRYTMKQEVQELVIANIEESEIKQLFLNPPEESFEGYRDRLMLEMFYGLGITPTKLTRIEKVEFDEQQQQISIYSGKQIRTLPVAPPAAKVLQQYQLMRQIIMEHTEHQTTAFLITEDGKNLTRKKIIDAFKKELARIGVIGEHVQMLRNLSTKHFTEHGADVRSLQTQRDMKSFHSLDLFKDESFSTVLEQFKKLHIRENSSSE
ncbi:MAG: tyrosine-type recombinase/integrase [SAR324 cluster bacterium]|nr:tyrosine-type recombinase/integrase [SAR324 cluster bacterium]